VDDGPEFAALLGQVVLDPHRRAGDHAALDQARGTELAQALDEHGVAHTRDGGAQLGEAMRTAEGGVEDGAGPATADKLHGGLEAGAAGVLLGHWAGVVLLAS